MAESLREETNVVGNVYFANYFLWQGKCREDFIRRYAPGVLAEFKRSYGMITRESQCVFHEEAFAFDGILIHMGLDEYYREHMNDDDERELKLLAQGRQTALWTDPDHRVSLLPDYLYEAIREFVRD